MIYTTNGEELAGIQEIHKEFMTYKRITNRQLFCVRFYSAPAEKLFNEIKQTINVVKMGMTRDYIIPEEIYEQDEIPKTQIPGFYRNKRVIGISNILSELLNNYSNKKPVWIYNSRNQALIYSTCKEVRDRDMEELRK